LKTCLTIAGSDCSGGAGIQADLKTFSALGVFGMSVIVSVVAENTCKVVSTQEIDLAVIADQLDCIFDDIAPDAIKVGMLPTSSIMRLVATRLQARATVPVVIDPVMVAKGGASLMETEAQETLRTTIIPCASLLTPNIPEAEVILGRPVETLAQMRTAAADIAALGAAAVLVKGGHRMTADEEAVDVLFCSEGLFEYRAPRIDTQNTHGTGCTLSSAIAAYLAQGLVLTEAVAQAKGYLQGAIVNALPLGHGHGPTNHFWRCYPSA
jgi:hydroxymethylpyrimidine/phosphomethylpyrimidine kinase